MNARRVAIQDIAFASADLFVEGKDLEQHLMLEDQGRTAKGLPPLWNVSPGKLGYLGVRQIGVPAPWQDSVTLTIEPTREILPRVGKTLAETDLWFHGSENQGDIDGARPPNAYAYEALQDEPSLAGRGGNTDVQLNVFACVGWFDALQNAANAISLGQADTALVTTEGLALYGAPPYHAGRATEGILGGAAYLVPSRDGRSLIDDAPVIMELDNVVGWFTNPVYDWGKAFGSPTPTYDGKFSELVYLDTLKHGMLHFESRARKAGLVPQGANFVEHFSERGFLQAHSPYERQQRAAFAAALRHAQRQVPTNPEVAELSRGSPLIPPKPTQVDGESLEEFKTRQRRWWEDNHARLVEDKKHLSAVEKTDYFRDQYERAVSGGTYINGRSGNSYPATVLGGVVSHLYAASSDPREREWAPFLLLGYGSGAKSKLISGTIGPDFRTVVKGWPSAKAKLDDRTKIEPTLQDALREYHISGTRAHSKPPEVPANPRPDSFAFVGTGKFGQPAYARV